MAGGPYRGPRGGLWADPEHTVHWDPQQGGVIHVRPHANTGMHPFDLHVVPAHDGHVRIGQAEDAKHGVVVPAESVESMVDSLHGSVHVPIGHAHPGINAVASGTAKFLGRGDDGVAFQHGKDVVKASTTTPYQPFNQGHLTHEQARDRLKRQVETGNMLADRGVPVLRSEYHAHGNRGFQIKPFVEVPDKLTRAQLDEAQAGLHAMHDAGHSMNDEIQVGIHNGRVVFFDTGKAAPSTKGAWPSESDDIDRLRNLYSRNGKTFSNMRDAEGRKAWDRYLGFASDAGKTGNTLIARIWLKRATTKLIADAKSDEDAIEEIKLESMLEGKRLDRIDAKSRTEKGKTMSLAAAIRKALAVPAELPAAVYTDPVAPGPMTIGRLPINVEYLPGQMRHGHVQLWAYAEIQDTLGADGEPFDVFLAPFNVAPERVTHVTVIDQINPETGELDEHKAMCGWATEAEAVNAYVEQYGGRERLGAVTTLPIDGFTRWARSSGVASAMPFREVYDDWCADPGMEKGKAHKYVKRVPIPGKTTKTGKQRFRYFYKVAHGGGITNAAHFTEGASFRHGEGHYHVTAADGDKLTLKHDETGHELATTKEGLGALLQGEHGAALKEAHDRVKSDWADALASGASGKQKAALKARAERMGVALAEPAAAKPKKPRAPKAEGAPSEPTESRPRAPRAEDPNKLTQVGDHIWGSRKDLAGLKGVDSSKDLESMSYADAAAVVRKSRMVAPLSLEQARADGKSPGTAHLALAVLAMVREKPDDSAEGRAAYVDQLRQLQGGLDRAKSVAAVMGVIDDMKKARGFDPAFVDVARFTGAAAGGDAQNHMKQLALENPGQKYGAYYESPYRRDTIVVRRQLPQTGDALGSRFVQMLEAPWKSKPLKDALTTALKKLDRGNYSTTEYSSPHRVSLWPGDPVMTQDQAWDWLKASTAKAKTDVESEKPKKPDNTERGHSKAKAESAEVVRVGGRDVPNADPKRAKDTFGFREIDYGNYMSQADRDHHTKALEGATHDLVDLLGITPKQASFNGRLGIAMGARGAGKAAAHYEPGRHAINLTKFAGGGSYAHEWGHALDDIVGRHHLPDRGQAGGRFLSANTEHSQVPADLAGAFKAIHSAMWQPVDVASSRDQHLAKVKESRAKLNELSAEARRLGSQAFDISSKPVDASDLARRIGSLEQSNERAKEERAAFLANRRMNPDRIEREVERLDAQIRASAGAMADLKAGGIRTDADTAKLEELRIAKNKAIDAYNDHVKTHNQLANQNASMSDYGRAAVALDNGKHGKKDAYWTSPQEMFARAFESYAADKLAEMGRKNTYLTAERKGNDGSRYPQGEERKRINAAIDRFMGALKAGKHLEKAVASLPSLRARPRPALSLATALRHVLATRKAAA